VINEAAPIAARAGQATVTQRDLSDALEKIQLGAERNVVMPPEERRRTAYHEAGHALLGMLQPARIRFARSRSFPADVRWG
jgi:cell division protease FtsH